MLRRNRSWSLAVLLVLAGCAAQDVDPDERPFFQPEYELESHGRKSWLDQLLELDPGRLDVYVSPAYLDDPPLRVAVLPFTDLGSAQFIVNRIPLTSRDQITRAHWAWTDSQRLRRAFLGYLAAREFITLNTVAIDEVLKQRGIRNRNDLEQASPRELGELLGADALVYGDVTSYEAWYLLLAAWWQVGVHVRMVSTRDGSTLVEAAGSRYSVDFRPAIQPVDIALSAIFSIFQLRDVKLARSEEEICREIVLRIPRSERNRRILADQALERASGEVSYLAPPPAASTDPRSDTPTPVL
jgi:hypothetical protein